MNILNIGEKVFSDHSITSKEYHTYLPYANTSLNKADEIRIPIQAQDVYTYPGESYIEIQGIIMDENKKSSTTLEIINNGILFLFDEIRYELGGTLVDRVRSPGITTLMKGFPSFTGPECLRYQNAGWTIPNITKTSSGYFNVCIPLKIIMGVFEDFKKIILNVKQELILIRSFSDNNCLVSSKVGEKANIRVDKVAWHIEHVKVDDSSKLKLLNFIEQGRDLSIAFRGWELHEYPSLKETMQHTWNVKAINQMEKPRFIIFGFQSGRKNNLGKNNSVFDHCDIANFKVYLNSEIYPYDNLNLNFEKGHYSKLYEMFARFQQSYYYKNMGEPCIGLEKFKEVAPLVVIDCCYQVDTIKNGNVDVRFEFETNKNIPALTSAYALILHDKKIRYNPLTSIVKSI